MKNKTCGIYIFDKHKKLLITQPLNSKKWAVPYWKHSNNEDHLEVAQLGAYKMANVSFFNHKEEYFKGMKYEETTSDIFVPFIDFGETFYDEFKCNIGDDYHDEFTVDWKLVTKKEALKVLNPLHINALNRIKGI